MGVGGRQGTGRVSGQCSGQASLGQILSPPLPNFSVFVSCSVKWRTYAPAYGAERRVVISNGQMLWFLGVQFSPFYN